MIEQKWQTDIRKIRMSVFLMDCTMGVAKKGEYNMIDVDTLLGDHKTRYFGEGHKRTNYCIDDLSEDTTYGKIIQSGIWSNKSDKVIQPHLSTLDGIMLSCLIAEKYLKNQNKPFESYCLSKFEIKSGMQPIENLNRIPMQLKKVKVDIQSADFEVAILDMKVKISFQQFANNLRYEVKAEDSKQYLPNHLKDIKHSIYDVSFLDTLDTADKCSIFCKANKVMNSEKNYSGISSNFSDSYSILELLIVFSQMAEMLAYHVDDVDRECSETLWMKHVSAELLRPIPNDEISLFGKITKSKLLDMKGKDWKIFEMSGTDTKNRVRMSSKIAHQLPSRKVKNNV